MTYTSGICAPESRVPEQREECYYTSGQAGVDAITGRIRVTVGQPSRREAQGVRELLVATRRVKSAARHLGFHGCNPLRDRIEGQTPWGPGEWEKLKAYAETPVPARRATDATCKGCGATFQTSKPQSALWCSTRCRSKHRRRSK